jgi:putative ATP-dependent endonuclease of OLD family
LPIFAKEFFGLFPYELGVTFINVGGKGNYRPYINLLESLKIKWLILSDSEEDTIEDVIKQIEEVNGDLGRVFLLPKEDDFEKFILREYENEVRTAIANFHTENSSIVQFNNQKLKKWLEKPIKEIETFMNGDNKAKVSVIYSDLIIANQDIKKRMPSIIEELFRRVQKELNCNSIWLKSIGILNLIDILKQQNNETETI